MKPTLRAAEPVSAYDAKTHLPKLLERAERGESFVITRHGRPVAQLIPIEPGDAPAALRTAARGAELRSKLARRGVRLESLLAPGEALASLTHAGHRR